MRLSGKCSGEAKAIGKEHILTNTGLWAQRLITHLSKNLSYFLLDLHMNATETGSFPFNGDYHSGMKSW